MPRPVPTRIVHFTHVSHLPTVASQGLLCDTSAGGLMTTEVGNRGIKDHRRRRHVDVGAGGVVGDYVPFYFAPRSPMLSAIYHERVPEYTEGQDPIVYLVTSVERLIELGLAPVFTDRNAALAVAEMSAELSALDDLVDWELMEATWWNNTPEDPERRERRMAECLVHQRVPWEAFVGVVTRTEGRRTEADDLLATVGISTTVVSRPEWYF
jgi:hypothetical protein